MDTGSPLADHLVRLRDSSRWTAVLAASATPANPAVGELVAALQRSRSHALEAIVDSQGWPTEGSAAQAALDVLSVADADPQFLRRCRDLAMAAAEKGAVPRWHAACIEDLLTLMETGSQRYGTRLRWTGEQWEPHPLAEPGDVDRLRTEVGLPSLELLLARLNERG